jgi:hypothetical protein
VTIAPLWRRFIDVDVPRGEEQPRHLTKGAAR